jgi:hypothetical protein
VRVGLKCSFGVDDYRVPRGQYIGPTRQREGVEGVRACEAGACWRLPRCRVGVAIGCSLWVTLRKLGLLEGPHPVPTPTNPPTTHATHTHAAHPTHTAHPARRWMPSRRSLWRRARRLNLRARRRKR